MIKPGYLCVINMNQFQTERCLCWCYGFLSIFLSVAVICIAIPYQHWRATLDVCPGNYLENTNCGCILFGVNTHQNFTGGHNSYCLYAILAPIPLIVYALVMVIFHMYRVCINNIGQYEDEKTAAMEEIEGESIVVTSRARVSHKNDAVIYCWIPSASMSTIFFVYNLVYASIITHGFLKTCTQYRSNVVKVLGGAGNHASAIHFRLSCQAIFDYMDYIQYNSLNVRRDETINTGVALQIALFAIWFSVCLWAAVSFYTAIRAFKERDVLTCCGK